MVICKSFVMVILQWLQKLMFMKQALESETVILCLMKNS